MGYYVHLSVVFACDDNEPVAALARKHRALIADLADDSQCEAQWFLDALAERTGRNPGPKGGVSSWGTIGNYTRAEIFVETLTPFFMEMLKTEAGPCDFEHVMVFYEPEQRERASAFEVFLSDDKERLIVKHHENLPFTWMQM